MTPATPPPLPGEGRRSPRVRTATVIVAGIVVLAGAAILFTFNPSNETFFPRCPLYTVTGWYCPGCGSTRCLHHLTHGRVATAFRYNPLLPTVLAFWAIIGAMKLLRRAGLIPAGSGKPLPAKWIWTIFAVIVLFGVLRNIPREPFTWLAPPR